jgi:heme iron utilization protein
MTDTQETPAAIARRVMRTVDRAALATGQRDAQGWPYPSLVLTAIDPYGSPLLLISTLADHTKNLMADPRCGLLFDATVGLDEPLTGARVSVLGTAARTDDPRHRDRFVARHPGAALYAGFGDFAVWRVTVERAHLVAGFGRIHWIAGDAITVPSASVADLAARDADVVGHMNADHADAVRLYATVIAGRADGDWRMTGIDSDGFDLRCGGQVARVAFDRPVFDAEAARVELVRLVKRARERLSTAPPDVHHEATT